MFPPLPTHPHPWSQQKSRARTNTHVRTHAPCSPPFCFFPDPRIDLRMSVANDACMQNNAIRKAAVLSNVQECSNSNAVEEMLYRAAVKYRYVPKLVHRAADRACRMYVSARRAHVVHTSLPMHIKTGSGRRNSYVVRAFVARCACVFVTACVCLCVVGVRVATTSLETRVPSVLNCPTVWLPGVEARDPIGLMPYVCACCVCVCVCVCV